MTARSSSGDERLLADVGAAVIGIARELQGAHAGLEGVVPLTPTEAAVLRHIDDHPGTSPSAAADATGLLRSNLSTSLRTLETRGLVERAQGVPDGRGVALHGTPLAADSIRRIRAHWAELLGAALDGDHTDAGLGAALVLLERLEAGLVAQRRASHRPERERS